jgi:hypothetical protein
MMAVMDRFTTKPIAEYTPEFFLKMDETETTCGGYVCGGPKAPPISLPPFPIPDCGGLGQGPGIWVHLNPFRNPRVTLTESMTLADLIEFDNSWNQPIEWEDASGN